MEKIRISSESMKSLLKEIGHVYVPALLANSKALERGEGELGRQKLMDQLGSKKPLIIKVNVFEWINQEFYSLAEMDQERILGLFEDTGCKELLMKESNYENSKNTR